MNHLPSVGEDKVVIDENPVLSFAIPTWNRYKETKECLDSMIKQIIEVNRNVEIFISDNAYTYKVNCYYLEIQKIFEG